MSANLLLRTVVLSLLAAIALAGCVSVPAAEANVRITYGCIYLPNPDIPPSVTGEHVPFAVACQNAELESELTVPEALLAFPTSERSDAQKLLYSTGEAWATICHNGPGLRLISSAQTAPSPSPSKLIDGRVPASHIAAACKQDSGWPAHEPTGGSTPLKGAAGLSGGYATGPSASSVTCPPENYDSPIAARHGNSESPVWELIRANIKNAQWVIKNPIDEIQAQFGGPISQDQAAHVGKMLEDMEYAVFADETNQAVDQAEMYADAAELAASAAGEVADAYGSDAAADVAAQAQSEAQLARMAAQEAAKAGAAGKEKFRNGDLKGAEADKAHAERLTQQAKEHAKKARDAYEKLRNNDEEYENPDVPESHQRTLSGYDDGSCAAMQQFLADCEGNWDRGECAIWLARLLGCPDPTISQGWESDCGAPVDIDEKDVIDSLCKTELVKPGPDGYVCGRQIEGRAVFTVPIPGTCDPTVAYGGCDDGSDEGPVELPYQGVIICPPPIPHAPVIPCIVMDPAAPPAPSPPIG